MWQNPPANLVTFTEETLMEKCWNGAARTPVKR